MPNLGPFHPQIVHFVVAGLLLGVGARLISLQKRWWTFTDSAAAVLLLIGATAAALAVQSGQDAHAPVERIPGVREAVQDHEEDGETTRDIFLGVAAIEIVALVFARRDRLKGYVRYAHLASAALGVVGCYMVYETAELGGRIVYAYGGGPGLRTGDTTDVNRVFVSALYNETQVTRRAGRSQDAAALMSQLLQRIPGNRDAQLLRAESQELDSKDYRGALATLNAIQAPADDGRSNSRIASMKADAYLGLGQRDSARAALQQVITKFPPNPRLKAKLDSIR